MSQFQNHIVKVLIVVVIISGFLTACNDNDLTSEGFTIGDELVDASTRIIYLDTITVNLSTVIIDSVQTSGYNIAQVGSYSDTNFGSIEARSYFQVGLTGSEIEEDDVYDSLTLVLQYSGNSYGDTLAKQTLLVYELDENLELNDWGYLTNTSSFETKPEPIGQLTYIPHPKGKKSIQVRISDDVGRRLFDSVQSGNSTTSEQFIKYFKGLVLCSQSDENAAIIGFNAVDTGMCFNLHYHRTELARKELKASFKLYDADLQYNQIIIDRSNTKLDLIDNELSELSSDSTDDIAYVQGMTGVLTRLKFPGLELFIEYGDQVSLLKAELEFRPVRNTYDDFPIPEDLVLYNTDRINRVASAILDASGESTQIGSVKVDYQYHEETSVTFDLTNYFRYDFIDNYLDPDYGFMLGLNSPGFNTSLNRVILGGENNKDHHPILKLYYILYE